MDTHSLEAMVRRRAPASLHSAAITVFNTRQYRLRRSGVYGFWRKYYSGWEFAPKVEWEAEQRRRLAQFIAYVRARSPYYSSALRGASIVAPSDLHRLPFLTKEDLRSSLTELTTIGEPDSVVSYTGGTTGASLKVLYLPDDVQERFAALDHFRSGYGYELGKRVAWFSGKELLRDRDIARGRFYRDDYRNRIRFFSTFHINRNTFEDYWAALIRFKPRFVVGFPTSVAELCEYASARGQQLPEPIEAFFPTAETFLPAQRELVKSALGGRSANQYASSEGAPFILECLKGSMHIHPLTGVFEVLDKNLRPARSGELVVTAFATRGTPLVRYRVMDRVTLAAPDATCSCGSSFPVVESVEGRTSDFLYSPYTGRCNLGNLSNSTKYVRGISHFQAVQDELDRVHVQVVADSTFTIEQQQRFLGALHDRLGESMRIEVGVVDSIPREASGKFRIVKNNILDLVPD